MPRNSTSSYLRHVLAAVSHLSSAAIAYEFTSMTGYAVALVSAFYVQGWLLPVLLSFILLDV